MPAGEIPTKIAPALWDALRCGDPILTAAQRPARALRTAFNQGMIARAEPQWTPASVLAVDTWMAAQWTRMTIAGDEPRMLLNRTQEHALWHDLIAADRDVLGLRSIDPLATMAADAWASLCLHNGRSRVRELGISTDTTAFERWAVEFERRCARAAVLPAAHLAGELATAVAEGRFPAPEGPLHLVDFTRIQPAIADLFVNLEQAGYTVERHSTRTQPAGEIRAAQDDSAELYDAAQWCRQQLQRSTSIAVVVPSIEDRRRQIERIFGQVLAPQSEPITAAPAPPLFEFSLGRPLAATAACSAALRLLRWTLDPLPLPEISALLLSPFVGGVDAEALAAARFDTHQLRTTEMLRPELSLEDFLDLLTLPGLSRRLRTMRSTALAEHLAPGNAADQQSHAEWTDAFRNVLEAAGWTAATQRDSLSYQQRERWESALDEVATLDFDGTLATAQEALEHLTRIVGQTIFAPESTNAPIQILGPLELGAVPFDALWFCGADDETWPPQPASQSLIPWSVQRSLGMPGADPARDTQAAQALTNAIANAATEVVFSYSLHDEEGPHRPSPLLAGFAWPTTIVPTQPDAEAAQPFEQFLDTTPIAPPPDEVMRGGASILQAQAACAFKAFAERRLRTSEPEEKDPGHDPRKRGMIVHDVMEHFWAQVENHTRLLALSRDERDALLDECIDEALRTTEDLSRTAWEYGYVQVQRERLRRLLQPWLDVEADRPPFEVKQQEQDSRDLAIGPLRLNVRVDRIDATEGGPLILDYKTGAATPSEWLSDRPDQPQLPLYAVLSAEPIGGVAFALLRPGDGLALKGYAVDDTVLAKPSRTTLPLAAQVDEWRRILTSLAEAFHAGDATVAPKCYPKTCEYCAQRILCRLNPTTLDDTADDDAQPAGYGEGAPLA